MIDRGPLEGDPNPADEAATVLPTERAPFNANLLSRADRLKLGR
jgi:hypothetical protein